MQNDVHDLPLDNSEHDNFDPYVSEEDVDDHVEGSLEEDGGDDLDSDDSYFITYSNNNSEHVKEKDNIDDLALVSEDSEDDDYYPEDPDLDKDIKEKKDESDFTSDTKK